MNKRTIFILLLILMLSAGILCASAEDETQAAGENLMETYLEEIRHPDTEVMYNSYSYITRNDEGDTIWRAPWAGIAEFRVPEQILNAKGTIRATGGAEIITGLNLVELIVNYIPQDTGEYLELVKHLRTSERGDQKEEANALRKEWMENQTTLFSVYGIGGGKGESDLKNLLKLIYQAWGLNAFMVEAFVGQMVFTELGSADDFNFFMVQNRFENLSGLNEAGAEYAEEYAALTADLKEYIPYFSLMKPAGIVDYLEKGTGISFEAVDVYGEPVSSADIFSKSKVTMVNIWGTYCNFCISEMPEMVRMNREFQEKGGQIIGIVYDAAEEDLVQEAREIIEILGVDYLNLLPNADIKRIFQTQSLPTTYFINEKGEVLGDPILGAQVKKYREMMEKYLSEVPAEE